MKVQKDKNIIMLNRLKLLSLELAVILVAFVLSLLIVAFFINRIFFVKKDKFDLRVFDFFRTYVSGTATKVMECFTFLGSQYFLIPAYILLIIYFLFIKKARWLGIKIAAVSISSLIVMFSLKLFFQRPRPLSPLLKQVQGLSFPSGHAFMSFSFFGLLMYILFKELRFAWQKLAMFFLLSIVVLMIGLSRIYLRVHYASDVITGFCMGFMWIVISLAVLSAIERHKNKLPVAAEDIIV